MAVSESYRNKLLLLRQALSEVQYQKQGFSVPCLYNKELGKVGILKALINPDMKM